MPSASSSPAEDAHNGLDQRQDDVRAQAEVYREICLFDALLVVHDGLIL